MGWFSFSLGLLLDNQCLSPVMMSEIKAAIPCLVQLLQTCMMQRLQFSIQKTLLLKLSRWLSLLLSCSTWAEAFSKVYGAGWLLGRTFPVGCRSWGTASWATPAFVGKTAGQKTMQIPGVVRRRAAEHLHLKQGAIRGTQYGHPGGGGGHMNQGGRNITWMG